MIYKYDEKIMQLYDQVIQPLQLRLFKKSEKTIVKSIDHRRHSSRIETSNLM